MSQKGNGVVYTPRAIVAEIVAKTLGRNPKAWQGKTIIDPACGEGAFLGYIAQKSAEALPAAKHKDLCARLHGVDIDANAIEKAHRSINETMRSRGKGAELRKADGFLAETWSGREGTYDAVVMNPPYIRIQHLEKERRNRIKEQGWTLLNGAADAYFIFIEIAERLLRQGGRMGAIMPSSWLRSNAGRKVRQHLAEKWRVNEVIDFGGDQMFEGVSTYCAILIADKGGGTDKTTLVRRQHGKPARRKKIRPDETGRPWTAGGGQSRGGTTLGEAADIHVGLQSLADRVYVLSAATRKGRGSRAIITCRTAAGREVQLEAGACRRILKASVMHDGRDRTDRVIIYPYDMKGRLMEEEVLATKFPLAYAWLEANRKTLDARDKGRGARPRWYAYGRAVGITSSFGAKILTPAISQRPNFQLCPDAQATFYSGYCVKPRNGWTASALLTELNSKRMGEFVETHGSPYRGGWWAYNKRTIEQFPLPQGIG